MKAHSLILENLGERLVAAVGLLLMTFMVYPETLLAAQVAKAQAPEALVFEINSNKSQTSNTEVKEKLLGIEDLQLADPNYHLEILVKEYLEKRGSPLAECTHILLTEAPDNWEKILSLANAESTLGKRYPKHTANMWGVGGSRLWDFGETPCDGVRGMNNFLNNYPKRGMKYKDMPIEKMNGLYKQPARAHWANNNYVILRKLAELKAEANRLALANTGTVTTSVAEAELIK